MVVGGCHSAGAERWWLKSEAMNVTPSGTTFLSLWCCKGLWAVQPRYL